jgi:hypothetical protein
VTLQSADRCVTGARDELSQVREWLLRPSAETLEACPPALERAVLYVHDLSAQIDQSHSDPALVQPLLALSQELRSAQRLLHAAGVLYFGRLRSITQPTT